MRARFYNPMIGRFTQEDIYRGDGLNLYAYCGNNPVGYYDPSGYSSINKESAFASSEGKFPLVMDLQLFANKGLSETEGQVSRNAAFRAAKRDAGIPNSVQGKKPVQVFDGSSENRIVNEFEVDGQNKYIVEHREDKFGRGFHFHGADDIKGSPLEKGRYNQYPGHFPDDFNGYTKK